MLPAQSIESFESGRGDISPYRQCTKACAGIVWALWQQSLQAEGSRIRRSHRFSL